MDILGTNWIINVMKYVLLIFVLGMLSGNGCVDLKSKIDPQVGVASKQIQGDNSGNTSNDFWPIVIGAVAITLVVSFIAGVVILWIRNKQIDSESQDDKIHDDITVKCLGYLYDLANKCFGENK